MFIAKHATVYSMPGRRRKICISKSRPICSRVAAHSIDAPVTAATSPFRYVRDVRVRAAFRSSDLLERDNHNYNARARSPKIFSFFVFFFPSFLLLISMRYRRRTNRSFSVLFFETRFIRHCLHDNARLA